MPGRGDRLKDVAWSGSSSSYCASKGLYSYWALGITPTGGTKTSSSTSEGMESMRSLKKSPTPDAGIVSSRSMGQSIESMRRAGIHHNQLYLPGMAFFLMDLKFEQKLFVYYLKISE